MKKILFFVLAVLSFNTFADTFEVKCISPFVPNGIEFFSTDVKEAYIYPYGTQIVFKDGTVIKYSMSVQCKVIKKD